MRIYNISCPGCGWATPLPVDERVADEFRKKKYCLDCKEKRNERVPFIIRETIITGPSPYFSKR